MKLRPEVAAAVEVRLVAAMMQLRFACGRAVGSGNVEAVLDLVKQARLEIADAVQCIDAGKCEEPIAKGYAWHPGAENDTEATS